MPQRADEIVRFWEEVGPEGWYRADAELDAEIRDRFSGIWEEAAAGGLTDWRCNPAGALAYLIVTDQFPRNMFRDDPRAFSTDQRARDAAMIAVQRDFDLKTDEPIRQFFYLPFMHAEDPFDQDRCVRLFVARMPRDRTREPAPRPRPSRRDPPVRALPLSQPHPRPAHHARGGALSRRGRLRRGRERACVSRSAPP
jgi:uncharacterized protein (DUF924 family)